MAFVAIVGAAMPAGVILAAITGWAVAVGLAVYLSPEPRALVSGAHD
jgi:hypothetical protein